MRASGSSGVKAAQLHCAAGEKPMSETHAVTAAPVRSIVTAAARPRSAPPIFCIFRGCADFRVMALLTPSLAAGLPDALCSSASPLSGMVPMYLLMSAFHLARG